MRDTLTEARKTARRIARQTRRPVVVYETDRGRFGAILYSELIADPFGRGLHLRGRPDLKVEIVETHVAPRPRSGHD